MSMKVNVKFTKLYKVMSEFNIIIEWSLINVGLMFSKSTFKAMGGTKWGIQWR